MAAPLAKGLLITASVLVAVGVACYENEQIREWILNARRNIAVALHTLGDEINPPQEEEDSEEAAASRRARRMEVIRLNRLELARQAAAGLPPSALNSLMNDKEFKDLTSSQRLNRVKTFDGLVDDDGTLRAQSNTATASGIKFGESGLRHRGAGARGFETGTSMANPFDDEAQLLFDRALIGTGNSFSQESTRTHSPDSERPAVPSAGTQYFSDDEMEAQLEEAIRRSLEDVTMANAIERSTNEATESSPENSFYAPPPDVHQPPINTQSLYSSAMEAMLEANLHHPLQSPSVPHANEADDEQPSPTGTLTPTDDGCSIIDASAASIVNSAASDIARLSDVASMVDEQDLDMDARSETNSEPFSMVGSSTPGGWTDVESEAGEEEGHQTQPPIIDTHMRSA